MTNSHSFDNGPVILAGIYSRVSHHRTPCNLY